MIRDYFPSFLSSSPSSLLSSFIVFLLCFLNHFQSSFPSLLILPPYSIVRLSLFSLRYLFPDSFLFLPLSLSFPLLSHSFPLKCLSLFKRHPFPSNHCFLFDCPLVTFLRVFHVSLFRFPHFSSHYLSDITHSIIK